MWVQQWCLSSSLPVHASCSPYQYVLSVYYIPNAQQLTNNSRHHTYPFRDTPTYTSSLPHTQDELCEQSDTRVIFRLPGGCIALHPPLYPRLRRDPRCAATASDYLHAAVSTAIFLSVVLLSPPVTLCLFPGTEPGTSRVGGIWSMFVPLIVTLLGGTLIALLDTPLRAPLGFGSCTARHGVVEEGGVGVEEGGEVVQVCHCPP